jgi:hypothetical protein
LLNIFEILNDQGSKFKSMELIEDLTGDELRSIEGGGDREIWKFLDSALTGNIVGTVGAIAALLL